MSQPTTVTVCIATYNQREWIEQCVRSVADQEVEAELRILVGDDESDDGTSDVVARLAIEYPGRVCHFRRVARMGPYGNMRDLLNRAEGDFVARVDGDDYWLPGKLQPQLAFLQAHHECAAVYTNAITVDEADNRVGLFNDVGDARIDLSALLRRGNFLNNSSILYRRDGLAGCLRTNAPQIDYRGHLWLARSGWLAQLAQPLTAYRINTRGSMIANQGDAVRELYWEAIQSVPRELVSDNDYAHGIADFTRRVLFATVRRWRWGLLRSWLPTVLAASPYGRLRTLGLIAGATARAAWCMAYGKVKAGRYGRGAKVRYRR